MPSQKMVEQEVSEMSPSTKTTTTLEKNDQNKPDWTLIATRGVLDERRVC